MREFFGVYYGSKYQLADWVISSFPPRSAYGCYCEPFGGLASVLMRMTPPTPVEVYNDLDREVVTMFRVLRERPLDVAAVVSLTPYSREELLTAYTPAPEDHPDRDLEIARRFLVRAIQSRAGPSTQYHSGWRYIRTAAKRTEQTLKWTRLPKAVLSVADRMRLVQVENDPAVDVIRRYDSPRTLFYVDPPYLASTRHVSWRERGYRCEMTDEGHDELAGVLKGCAGFVVISSVVNDVYDTLYRGWSRVTMMARTVDARTQTEEALYISPSVVRARLPLFEVAGGGYAGGV